MDEKMVMEGMTFDDVLLLPGYADFKRADVDLTTTLHPSVVLALPLLSSPMDTVTEEEMARAMARAGGLGIIHRNLSVDNQAEMVASIKRDNLMVGAAVGVGADFEARVTALLAAHVDIIVVDSGHGDTTFVVDAVTTIKKRYPQMVVMAGNVATSDGAKRLAAAGADILRVGMGPGSICTTRIITGMGVPQMTAIREAVKGVAGTRVTVVADGGVKQIGDIAKALGAGAHAVMVGGLLAGFDESPGEIVTIEDQSYKHYRGMGSVAAMQKGSAERYGQSKDAHKGKLIPEGVEGFVKYKGAVANYLDQVAGSLRSSFYYVGAQNLSAFHKNARFIRITPASHTESHPHSITILDTGSNYNRT